MGGASSRPQAMEDAPAMLSSERVPAVREQTVWVSLDHARTPL